MTEVLSPTEGVAAGAHAGRVTAYPTIWGLDPLQLHDRFWAARGVQVVRQGQPSEIVEDAELFLLLEPRTLAIFRLRDAPDLVSLFSWIRPDVLFVRVRSFRSRGYQETVRWDEQGKFLGVRRIYGGGDTHLTRVAFTRDQDLVRAWQSAPDPLSGWRKLRRQVPRTNRETATISGRIYDNSIAPEVMQFTRDLINVWKNPAATISRATKHGAMSWVDPTAEVAAQTRFVNRVWIGAGRRLEPDVPVVGPAALWDDPNHRPTVEGIRWQELEAADALNYARPRQLSSFARGGKRLFDILFAVMALLLTLPLYPFIMAAIWLEDGRPFFFAHKREARGGREFGCLKFRSMRRDAEKIKAKLAAQNTADGPQFHIPDDPRLTKVGIFIRKWNIDELPQFWNILRGDMSVVGPRPSPHHENQYCPPWRETRLSVRPGITGLWQVKRTRRQGLDFQEWIRYDFEYVQNMSLRLDMKIIAETITIILLRSRPS